MTSNVNKFIVCAFYTDAYSKEIEQLKGSLLALNIGFHIKKYASRGYWEANTRIKPEFLSECLDQFKNTALVYVDADAVVRKHLDLFDVVHEDIGVFCVPSTLKYSHKFLTGTLYLANNDKVKKFVNDWIAFQSGTVLGVDQDSFELAMEANPELTVLQLPESYVKIFDKDGEVAVIEHFQASRKRVKLQRLIKKIRNALFISSLVLLFMWILKEKLLS